MDNVNYLKKSKTENIPIISNSNETGKILSQVSQVLNNNNKIFLHFYNN